MGCIEPLVVLPVAALYLAVVPGGVGTDHFVADAVALQIELEHSRLVPLCGKAVGELRPVVRLVREMMGL